MMISVVMVKIVALICPGFQILIRYMVKNPVIMRIVIKNLMEKDMILKVAVTVWKVEILRMNIAHPGKSDILLHEMSYGNTTSK